MRRRSLMGIAIRFAALARPPLAPSSAICARDSSSNVGGLSDGSAAVARIKCSIRTARAARLGLAGRLALGPVFSLRTALSTDFGMPHHHTGPPGATVYDALRKMAAKNI